MEHKTWTTVDKTSWGPGPWQDEPDKEQWQDEATGLACLIKRSPRSGGLCGYIGVPHGHPWYGQPAGQISPSGEKDLTYAGACQEGPEAFTICHVPGPGEPGPLWWVGFHHGYSFQDIEPGQEARDRAQYGWEPIRVGGETYSTIADVKTECASLARLAAAAGS